MEIKYCIVCNSEFKSKKSLLCSKICYDKNRYNLKLKKQRLANKEIIFKRFKLYRKNNKQLFYNYDKKRALTKERQQYIKSYRKEYYLKNKKELIQKQQIYDLNKYHSDILFKLKKRIRGRIRDFLKLKNWDKTHQIFKIVECSPIELKLHLEKQFKDNMNWKNYGEWHIDHIIPLAKAKNELEVYKLSHYTNLQPLWALDNFKKGSKCEKNL